MDARASSNYKRDGGISPKHEIVRWKKVKLGKSRTLVRACSTKSEFHDEERRISRIERASKKSLPGKEEGSAG